MDRERLFKVIGEKYLAKNELYGYLPLGVNADEVWGTVLEQRRAKGITLPLTNADGKPYWYTLTDKMILASENIVNELFEQNDNNKQLSSIMTISELYFTGYLEGSQISVQDAMSFLQRGEEPHDIEELMILNNRQAGGFAAENIYRPLNEDYIKTLSQILTNGLDNGGGELRTADTVEIYSMQGENYNLPSAARLNGCIKEITAFLADLSVHPLIKSAVAQAWTMAVRPFPEGNERLGRLLSEIILVRSGYTFFSEDSISEIIAKSGFKYFDAIAKILRNDNGGDLTYFLEYYLSVLSSFVDHVRYKRKKKEDDAREAEKEMARHTFESDPINESVSDSGEKDVDVIKECPITMKLANKLQYVSENAGGANIRIISKALQELLLSGLYEFTVADLLKYLPDHRFPNSSLDYCLLQLKRDNIISIKRIENKNRTIKKYCFILDNTNFDNEEIQGKYSYDHIYDVIYTFTMSKFENSRKLAAVLLEYLRTGKKSFTALELKDEANVSSDTVYNFLRKFLLSDIIKINYNRYWFCYHETDKLSQEELINVSEEQSYSDEVEELVSISEEQSYSDEVYELIKKLCESEHSTVKDKRIGSVIQMCLDRGIITKNDYAHIGESKKMRSDMVFAEQLGLVEQISEEIYKIKGKVEISLDG